MEDMHASRIVYHSTSVATVFSDLQLPHPYLYLASA